MIKIRFVSKALCLVVFSLFVQMGLYAQNEKPFVIPELKEWKGSEGVFTPSADMRVVYAQEALRSVAEAFAADYGQMFGLTLEVIQGKPSAGDIYFTLKKDKKLGREGYGVEKVMLSVRIATSPSLPLRLLVPTGLRVPCSR